MPEYSEAAGLARSEAQGLESAMAQGLEFVLAAVLIVPVVAARSLQKLTERR